MRLAACGTFSRAATVAGAGIDGFCIWRPFGKESGVVAGFALKAQGVAIIDLQTTQKNSRNHNTKPAETFRNACGASNYNRRKNLLERLGSGGRIPIRKRCHPLKRFPAFFPLLPVLSQPFDNQRSWLLLRTLRPLAGVLPSEYRRFQFFGKMRTCPFQAPQGRNFDRLREKKGRALSDGIRVPLQCRA